MPASYYAALHADGNSLGDPAAPVLLEVYSDYQCPHCRNFWLSTVRRIESAYVKPGIVRIAAYSMGNRLSDRAPGNTESQDAARAAYAAGAQNMFWVYHDLLYARQGTINTGLFSGSAFVDLAGTAGLDLEGFRVAMGSAELRDRVQKDAREGKSRGVQIVPTVVVNGTLIPGEQRFDTYQAAIERALSAAAAKAGGH